MSIVSPATGAVVSFGIVGVGGVVGGVTGVIEAHVFWIRASICDCEKPFFRAASICACVGDILCSR